MNAPEGRSRSIIVRTIARIALRRHLRRDCEECFDAERYCVDVGVYCLTAGIPEPHYRPAVEGGESS